MKLERFFERRVGDVAIFTIPMLGDNYAYVVASDGRAVAIDPGDEQPVLQLLEMQGLTLDMVVNTHHHFDHVGGNIGLRGRTGCEVAGPRENIPAQTRVLDDNEQLLVGRHPFAVLACPGHTLCHVAYRFPQIGVVFTGDALFGGGCGRLIEGSAEIMWEALMRLAALPEETLVFFGHEYTVENLEFALELEHGNESVRNRLHEARALRKANQPTAPSTIGIEKTTNPFLRSGSEEVREALGIPAAWAVRAFAELRARKDRMV